jgi:predicted dehydrogenase
MRILFVGLGSIGQRHLRNIKRLYGDDVEIMAYRVRGLSRTFSDDMKIKEGVDLEKAYNIKVFSDYTCALNEKPDAVFITNITSKHVEFALKAAEAKCDIFMEKPLSDSMQNISELVDVVKANSCVFYMGYQNRYHPCIIHVREVLEQGVLGRLLSVDNEFSERLSTMHTYEDYRQTYMARKEMGGGPVLNLQIHCFDYLQWLLGTPLSVYSVCPKTSALEVDVESSSSSIFEFMTPEGYKLPVYTHTDFFQFPPVHKFKIVGEKGRIEADINKATFRLFIDGELKEEEVYGNFVRNDMFITEIQDFFKHIQERNQSSSDISQGVVGLRMALAAKQSAEKHMVINL